MRFIEKTDCKLFVNNGSASIFGTCESMFLLRQIFLLTLLVAAESFQILCRIGHWLLTSDEI